MFDNLKGMAALAGALKDLPRIKARLQQVKQRLGDVTVEGSSGGGAVVVVATGSLRIVDVRCEPALLASAAAAADEANRRAAEDLIAEAVNEALALARALAQREVADAAAELGLPIPPGMLDGFA